MDDLQAFLHAVGATPNPGATAAELAAFEARTGLSLPSQLRAFYGLRTGSRSTAAARDMSVGLRTGARSTAAQDMSVCGLQPG